MRRLFAAQHSQHAFDERLQLFLPGLDGGRRNPIDALCVSVDEGGVQNPLPWQSGRSPLTPAAAGNRVNSRLRC
jgi:hypothetical protein